MTLKKTFHFFYLSDYYASIQNMIIYGGFISDWIWTSIFIVLNYIQYSIFFIKENTKYIYI